MKGMQHLECPRKYVLQMKDRLEAVAEVQTGSEFSDHVPNENTGPLHRRSIHTYRYLLWMMDKGLRKTLVTFSRFHGFNRSKAVGRIKVSDVPLIVQIIFSNERNVVRIDILLTNGLVLMTLEQEDHQDLCSFILRCSHRCLGLGDLWLQTEIRKSLVCH